MTTMLQLAFRWPSADSHAVEDLIVSDFNEQAARFLRGWPDGKSAAAVLSGPEASGKTHLAQYWRERVGGITLDKALLGQMPSDTLWPGRAPALLEDITQIKDEEALFHLLRHAETEGKALLLTSSLPVRGLPFTLPDLCSRLLSLPGAAIDSPDDVALATFIAKCFADRQLRVSAEVQEYMLKRVERSLRSVIAEVEKIEKASLEMRKEITVPLVRKILES
ncbi:MAG TPA: hypothetical protein VFT64_02400 [Rickettsiales bacterium]|nr:hypothetical protein [Rickettsiales bacterium]